jgi:type IV secretion system protein VirB4
VVLAINNIAQPERRLTHVTASRHTFAVSTQHLSTSSPGAARGSDGESTVNRLLVSPVALRGTADRASIRISRRASEGMTELRLRARDELSKLSAQLMASLKRYHPRLLGTYGSQGALCSRTAEFYCRLLNNTDRHIRLDAHELSQSLQAAALNFGAETLVSAPRDRALQPCSRLSLRTAPSSWIPRSSMASCHRPSNSC